MSRISPAPPHRPDRQHAALTLRIGRRTKLKAEVDVSAAGLWAIGGLVSAILLSSAAIVAVAGRARD